MSLKGKTNAWITNSGRFIPCGYMGHDTWAWDYFWEKYPGEAPEKVEEFGGRGSSATAALHSKGWVRLLTWAAGKTHAYGNCAPSDGRINTMDPALNDKQKKTLIDWCMENNYQYEELFKD